MKFKSGVDIDFDEWDGWRQESGLLCRNTTDCSWLDVDLRVNVGININTRSSS